VINRFRENAAKINILEYQMQRIDTFANGGIIWNNKGIALIEKDVNDKIFGFSFYGKRDDVDEEYIYDAGNSFEINKINKNYRLEPGDLKIIGSPGGQMIHRNIFKLDSSYKKVSFSESDDSYFLSFEFENDTTSFVSNRIKIYELNKVDFFPVQIKQISNQLGNKSVTIAKFSGVKINENVTNSIKEIKKGIQNYEIIQPVKRKPNALISKKIPKLKLPNLFNNNSHIVKIKNYKLTLIDFWEAWCGPCIASFSKVENLKSKFKSELNVIGIVSEDLESAIKITKKKGTTFQNLIGNNHLKKEFNVYSYPRYFLIDKNGTLLKEYYKFSEEIERDIKENLNK
jgi:thiol-disulfide isomerase/thioredoxin